MQFSSQNPAIVTTMFSSANPDSVRRNVAWSNEPIDDELFKMYAENLKQMLKKANTNQELLLDVLNKLFVYQVT